MSGEIALWVAVLVLTLQAATPLAFAALGELVAEKAGCVNLGVEGMMLVGAASAFAVAMGTGNLALAFVVGALAGAALSLVYAGLVLGLNANQYAAGIALTILGTGAAAVWGEPWQGQATEGLRGLDLPLLRDLPLIGPAFARLDAMVWGALLAVATVAWLLARTRAGLVLRAVGENPDSAHALGHPVLRVRLLAIAFGGAMAGIGGAYLSCALIPVWAEGLTAGRGWIAVALVVAASWKPWRVLPGAVLLGLVGVLPLQGPELGIDLSRHLLAMLPYAVTIAVLVAVSSSALRLRLATPRCLGKPFRPGG